MPLTLALALATLALSGAGPTLAQPHLVWIYPLGSSFPVSVSVGRMGVFVAAGSEARRYDFDGSLVWTRQVGHLPYAVAMGVASGLDGIYVVGFYSFVQKLDFNGNLIWSSQFGGLEGSHAESVSVDSTGVYVAGGSDFASRQSIGIVEKFDHSGNEIWTRQIHAIGFSTVMSGISVGPKGVYVVGGNTCPAHIRCDPSPESGSFMKAFDHNGNEQWTRPVDGGRVSVGPAGLYVWSYSSVQKLDLNGNPVWTVASGPPGTFSMALSADSSGVFVVGLRYDVLPFGAFVEHLNSDGTETWSIFFGTSPATGVSVSPRGIFVAGLAFIAKVCASPSCLHS